MLVSGINRLPELLQPLALLCLSTNWCGRVWDVPCWGLLRSGCITFVTEWYLSGTYLEGSYLVDPASSHMLVSKIKPCMSKYKHLYCETANGSLNQLSFI